jgi:hypothetical protein
MLQLNRNNNIKKSFSNLKLPSSYTYKFSNSPRKNNLNANFQHQRSINSEYYPVATSPKIKTHYNIDSLKFGSNFSQKNNFEKKQTFLEVNYQRSLNTSIQSYSIVKEPMIVSNEPLTSYIKPKHSSPN